MTNKKSITSKSVPAHLPLKLDAATLRNMAHHLETSCVNDASIQRIADMLTKLSPSNVDLVTNIIRCILAEQTPEE